MYELEKILARYKKNGILLGSDSRWLLKVVEELYEVVEFYGHDANWLPIQYGTIIETEVDRDGGQKAKDILEKIEKED